MLCDSDQILYGSIPARQPRPWTEAEWRQQGDDQGRILFFDQAGWLRKFFLPKQTPIDGTGLDHRYPVDITCYLNAAGDIHRDGEPAVIGADGLQEYWVDGKLHRQGDLPAVEHANGSVEYWLNGHLHRDFDLPAIDMKDIGHTAWYRHGKRHRMQAPALITYGYKEYYLNGKLHREDGPAQIKQRIDGIEERYALDDVKYGQDRRSWKQALRKWKREQKRASRQIRRQEKISRSRTGIVFQNRTDNS